MLLVGEGGMTYSNFKEVYTSIYIAPFLSFVFMLLKCKAEEGGGIGQREE